MNSNNQNTSQDQQQSNTDSNGSNGSNRRRRILPFALNSPFPGLSIFGGNNNRSTDDQSNSNTTTNNDDNNTTTTTNNNNNNTNNANTPNNLPRGIDIGNLLSGNRTPGTAQFNRLPFNVVLENIVTLLDPTKKKKHASQRAIDSLITVNSNDLPETERVCPICYESYQDITNLKCENITNTNDTINSDSNNNNNSESIQIHLQQLDQQILQKQEKMHILLSRFLNVVTYSVELV
ncbi:unnamed protein product [[Candida] boidinii]|nr:unnamed protein product [[Candida] boidinii]